MKKIEKEQKIKTMARNKRFLFLIGLIILFLVVLQIILSNLLISYGQRLKTLDVRLKELSEEQERLSRQLAENKSLMIIASKAEELGFVEVEKLIYLSEARAQIAD